MSLRFNAVHPQRPQLLTPLAAYPHARPSVVNGSADRSVASQMTIVETRYPSIPPATYVTRHESMADSVAPPAGVPVLLFHVRAPRTCH